MDLLPLRQRLSGVAAVEALVDRLGQFSGLLRSPAACPVAVG